MAERKKALLIGKACLYGEVLGGQVPIEGLPHNDKYHRHRSAHD